MDLLLPSFGTYSLISFCFFLLSLFFFFFLCVCASVAQLCPTLQDPMDVAHQAPLSMGFSRQEYWSGLPCPSPGVLPDAGIKPRSPALQVGSLPSELPGKPKVQCICELYTLCYLTELLMLDRQCPWYQDVTLPTTRC